MSTTDPFAAPETETVHRPGEHAAETTSIFPSARATYPEPPEAALSGQYQTRSTAAENEDAAPAGETDPDKIAEARANASEVTIKTSAEAVETGALEADPAESDGELRASAGGPSAESTAEVIRASAEGTGEPHGPTRRERGLVEAINNDEVGGPDRNERGQVQADNTDEVNGPLRNERGQTEALEGGEGDHASDANHDGPDAAGIFLDGTDHRPDVLRERREGGESEEGWGSHTIPELKAELERRELPVSGNKPELIARLQQHDKEQGGDQR